jgi:GH15 family glucan-1,4-alpha-glucosidase
MSELLIGDYAVVGDCQTAALVGRDGSVDWLCLPRFDSGACFSCLLGEPRHGRWLLAPAGKVVSTRRRYVDRTLVLQTEFETAEGVVALTDFMPVRDGEPHLVRIVEGRSGAVPVRMELVMRFDYGSVLPWVQRGGDGLTAIAGPDMLVLRTPAPMRGEKMTTVAEFTVSAGQRVPFVLSYQASHLPAPAPIDPEAALKETTAYWHDWSGRCTYQGAWKDQVLRSLITLKALIYAPTGGIVAAATTSLPEQPGGVRNWDYRFCWLRDATFTLMALVNAGYLDEAGAWRDWLLRAIAGDPNAMQIMYGVRGERRLSEFEVPWLPGYGGAKPVRVGNAASQQFQLDVFGETMDALYQAHEAGLPVSDAGWRLALSLLEHLESVWHEPDDGIWEVRGPRRHFTQSKVMAWVAFDRAVRAAEQHGRDGPVERWRQARDAIHRQVCEKGFDPGQNTFVQSYGAKLLDASLLMIPLVGFLPADDPRVRGTVAAVEKHLMKHGFVERYKPSQEVDGLPPGEGAFLPCTFWLADNLALLGRRDDAVALFGRLLALTNDVGLLSEEYDPQKRCLLGNFPQAFTHVGLVNTAMHLDQPSKSAAGQRSSG